MFRPMRRNERQLSQSDAERILSAANYGVLSVTGDGSYPYGSPINYAYAEGKIYFHATSAGGHRLDALRRDDRVCLTVVTRAELITTDTYSTDYESAIVFGRARIIAEPDEKRRAMAVMMRVLAPEVNTAAMKNCGGNGYVMVEITPEHITGKARRK